jgi:hypothetical protein
MPKQGVQRKTLEQATSGWTLDRDGGVFAEDDLKVWTSAATQVQSQRDEALRSRVLLWLRVA